jgi:thioredoxin 1
MALEVNDSNFDEMIIKSDMPAVVDFWAEWCGPCRMVGPIINDIATEYQDKVVVAKLDVDSSPEISARFGIKNIPTVLFFKGGQVVDKQVGAVPKSTYINKLAAIL